MFHRNVKFFFNLKIYLLFLCTFLVQCSSLYLSNNHCNVSLPWLYAFSVKLIKRIHLVIISQINSHPSHHNAHNNAIHRQRTNAHRLLLQSNHIPAKKANNRLFHLILLSKNSCSLRVNSSRGFCMFSAIIIS